MNYPEEKLDEYDDDGTMPANRDELAQAVVGHRITTAGKETLENRWGGTSEEFVITLDNGHKVILSDTADCCAYTELEAFLIHPELVDHIITGVGTTDGYTRWHIYADMGDVLDLNVGWSSGNPFYYGYGFHIEVKELTPTES